MIGSKEVASDYGKNLFVDAPSYLSKFAFVFFLSVVTLVLDYKYKKLEVVRIWVNTVLYPVYFLSDIPSSLSLRIQNTFVSKSDLLADNKNLKQINLHLSQRSQEYEVLEVENQRLRNLLNMSQRHKYDRVQIASVVRLDNSDNANELTLDKGIADGVYIGQPVLDDKGLLGQIVHVSYNTSKLLLISSPLHFVPVQVVRNSHRAIATGNGSFSSLNLDRVIENDDIEIGDELVTSGMGGVFPVGYKVGVVRTISKKPNLFLKVEISPYAHGNKVEEVLLIWPAQSTDKESEDNAG